MARRRSAEPEVRPPARAAGDASPPTAGPDDASPGSQRRNPPRDPGKPEAGWNPVASLLQAVRRVARRSTNRLRSLWRTFVVRRLTRAGRAFNRANVRRALAAIAAVGLAVAVVLELDPADQIAGYSFAILSALLGLGVVRDVLKAGELDLDLATAVAAFGGLALYQLV